jgi:large subunit ribosomal protein L11
MQIKLLIEGGEMKPGPTLGQKLGPLGIGANIVIQKVNEATKDFKGLKVPVELEIDPSTKSVEVKVFSPPVSELIKREIGVTKGSGNQKKMLVANASIEQIISVAKTKSQNLLCKDLKSSVKTVAGTCVSLGVLIENKPAKEIELDIDQGKFDKEIKEERIHTTPEKKKILEEYFNKVKTEQEKLIKQEQAAAEQAAAEAGKPAEGAVATPDAKKTEATKDAPKKEAAKPTKPAKK